METILFICNLTYCRCREKIVNTFIKIFCFFSICLAVQIEASCQDSTTDSLQRYLQKVSNDADRIGATLQLAEQLDKQNPFLALEYADESLHLAGKLRSDSLLIQANLRLAGIYLHLANYPRALQYYQSVLLGAQKLQDSAALFAAQSNMGSIFYYQHDYENALTQYLKALNQFQRTKQTNRITLIRKANLLNNIGIIYDETKRLEEAAHYYDDGLKLARELDEPEIVAYILNNQGTLYRDLGDNDRAFQHYREAMQLRKEQNDRLGLTRSYHNIGQFYFNQLKNFDSAEYYLKKAIANGEEIGLWETVASSSEILYKTYKNKGAYKDALEVLELNMRVNDSLFNEESTRKIAQLEMQFEFDRKQTLMAAAQAEKELYYWIGAGGIIFLLIIVTLLFFLQRNKTRRSQLEQAHLNLEKINLKNDLAIKDKELAANIMYLLNKNELINSISEKLLEIKGQVAPPSQAAVQKVVLDLQSNLQPELWQEFEFRFQQVHEHFYKTLNEKFPDLTPSEVRLCAFLKLNMTTKEISAITHQNAKSIDVARTRLRKKLNLTGTDHNLVTFLSHLDKPSGQA
jgi:tetratricopeptide (TPR) repeat protein/DNA-binding CsgD family transcriptional regulator